MEENAAEGPILRILFDSHSDAMRMKVLSLYDTCPRLLVVAAVNAPAPASQPRAAQVHCEKQVLDTCYTSHNEVLLACRYPAGWKLL